MTFMLFCISKNRQYGVTLNEYSQPILERL
jgi:hypothetical protein